ILQRSFGGRMSENRHLVIHGWILCTAGSSPVYSDTMCLQSCADGTDCAGLFHREAEIVPAFCIPVGNLQRSAGNARERSSAGGDFYDVGKNRTGAGQRTGAFAVE